MTNSTGKPMFIWMWSIFTQHQREHRDADSFFLIDDSFSDEEDGYLPSELNIDEFLAQTCSTQTESSRSQPKPSLLPWSTCMAIGALLGVATFVIYSLISTATVTKLVAEANPLYFHQPGQHPSLSRPSKLHDHLLNKYKWNDTNPPPSPCGNTSSTAHAAGCKFGAMAFAWYPSACYDVQTEAEFLVAEDWKWHSEPEVSYPISYESRIREADGEAPVASDEYQHPRTPLRKSEVLAGIHDEVYADAAYWDRFCEFAERKLWRAVAGAVGGDEEKILLDNYNIDTGQRKACLDDRPEDGTVLRIRYLDCIRW